MKHNNILLFLLIAIAFPACEETFSKDIIIDVPKQTKKLVIESITPPGGLAYAYVTQSVDVLDPINSNPFSQAFVTLYQNNTIKDTLVYNTATELYIPKNFTQLFPNNNYTIKASANGFTAVEASTDVPLPVPIQTMSYRPRFRTDANGQERDEIRFGFQDPTGAANFYMVKLQVPTGISGGTPTYLYATCLYTLDPDAETGLSGVGNSYDDCIEDDFVMKDIRFDGRLKEVTLQVKSDIMRTITNPANGAVFRPRIELRAITGDHYRYYKSKKVYEDAEDNPFAEPVSIYSNVKNGHGIFAAYTTSYKEVL